MEGSTNGRFSSSLSPTMTDTGSRGGGGQTPSPSSVTTWTREKALTSVSRRNESSDIGRGDHDMFLTDPGTPARLDFWRDLFAEIADKAPRACYSGSRCSPCNENDDSVGDKSFAVLF